MESMLGIFGLAVVLFVSTNVDDIFVLLGFFTDPKFGTRHIAIGQYIGMAALFGASLLASMISLVIPEAYVGLLGFAPIVIGLKNLWDWWRGSPDGDDPEDHEEAAAGHGKIAAVALVTIANGGDNIGVYVPVFATRTLEEIAAIAIIFAVLTAASLGAAHLLVNHPKFGAPIRHYGYRITPFMLVALGILILFESGTIALLSL